MKTNKLIIILTIVCLFISTIAYSALSTSLAITSNAHFRLSSDIRISNILLVGATNDAIENYKSDYGLNTTITGFTLPNSESSITYKVTISNNGEIDQTIYDIIVQSNNLGLEYTISDYNIKDIIGFKENISFNITFKTKQPSSSPINVVLKYNFKKVYYVTYYNTNIERQIKYENIPLKLTEEIPEKEGYIFGGWNDDESDNIKYLLGSLYEIDKDVILYPVFNSLEAILTIDPNGGKYNNSASAQIFTQKVGSTLEIDIPTRDGYTFDGWTLEGTGILEENIYIFGKNNTTLTAKWIPNNYKVNYYMGINLIGSQEFTYDQKTKLLSVSNLNGVLNGYTFYGWTKVKTNFDYDYSDEQLVENLSVIKDDIINLYPIYSRDVKFYSGMNKAKTIYKTQYYNPTSNEYKLVVPSNDDENMISVDNWEKSGWRTDTNSEMYNLTPLSITDSNVNEFYAVYTRKINIIYNGNGSTSGSMPDGKLSIYMNSNSNEIGNSGIELSLNKYEKDSYYFGGWAQGSVNGDKYPENSLYIPTITYENSLKDIEMYAVWIQYTASDLIYDNSISNIDCTTVQCAIDKINEMLTN